MRAGVGRLGTVVVGLTAALALLVPVAPAEAQSVQLAQFGGQTFASPLYVIGDPVDPGLVFVVERAGTIQLIKDGDTQPTPFLDISADVDSTRFDWGLYSMAFAPDYEKSGLFYVFYTRDSAAPPPEYYLRIEEVRRSAANPDVADISTRRIVLEIPQPNYPGHNGGQLQLGPDGDLYLSVGDGGASGSPVDNGQSTTTLLGKLLRIDPNGAAPFQYSIPDDNPFNDGAGPNADEIYSYGLRNPWRFSFDRATGDLTVGDVGEAAFEEVDFTLAGGGRGANFGWNCFEGAQPFSDAPLSCAPPPANHTPPVLEYMNPGTGGASVVGGYVIRDGALPSLLGRYVYADTSGALGDELRTAVLGPGGASGDAGLGVTATRVVSFGEDACAHIYVASIMGSVYRLEPSEGPFPCLPPVVPEPEPKPPPAAPEVRCRGQRATHVGTGGPDTIVGTSKRDVIVALAGNDRIYALGGNDLICAGRGADFVRSGSGNDRAFGQQGADRALGGSGRDALFGERGPDRLLGGDGADRLYGGLHSDLLIGARGRDVLVGGPQRDTLDGLAGRPDRCYGGPGRDVRRAIGCERRWSIP